MSRAHPAAVFATGALGACLAVLAFGPGTTGAGPEAADPPAARAGPVTFDTELVRGGGGAALRIRARNAGGHAQGCRVQAAVLRERGDPRSRVLATPEQLWSEAVALRVPAKGEAVRTLALPAGAASPPAAGNDASRDEALRVLLQPECSAEAGIG
jgi:hypothetical protein